MCLLQPLKFDYLKPLRVIRDCKLNIFGFRAADQMR